MELSKLENFFPALKRPGKSFIENKTRALTAAEEAEQNLKKLEKASLRNQEEKKKLDPNNDEEETED